MTFLDFSILRIAKVSQGEFAQVANVSRVTVNNWVHARLGVHSARQPRIEKLLNALHKAVELKKLPLSDVPHDRRLLSIKQVVVEVSAAN